MLNAAVAHGVDPSSYGGATDSLWLDFSKGLGAPFGAVLAGSDAFLAEAVRFKHMLGGAMRQAGIMAAACLHALDHNVSRLAGDHAAARRLAEGMRALEGIDIAGDVDTNIVIADVAGTGCTAAEIAGRLGAEDVRVGVFGATKLRLVTHRDVADRDIDAALTSLRRAMAGCSKLSFHR